MNIAQLLRPLGCRIVATDARVEEKPEYVDDLHRPDEIDALLPGADAIVLTVPHTPETFRLIDARRLRLMKPTALLVNIGRGAVVDIDALAEALAEGIIQGAALDVVPIREQRSRSDAHPSRAVDRGRPADGGDPAGGAALATRRDKPPAPDPCAPADRSGRACAATVRAASPARPQG